MRISKILSYIFLLGIISDSPGLHAQPDTSDWQGPRYYHQKFDQAFEARIQVIETAYPDLALKHPSPNGSYGYHWTDLESVEKLRLNIKVESGYSDFQITFLNPTSDLKPITRWLNEKLLYIRVFWRDDLGTDMILNVESRKFISKTMVHDGSTLFFKAREKTESPEIVNKRIAKLREWIVPPKGTTQKEVEGVYGKGQFHELPEGKFVRYASYYPFTRYLLLEDQEGEDGGVAILIQYQDGVVNKNPWLRMTAISGGRASRSPGTSSYLEQQWGIYQEKLRALNDLLKVEEMYRNALKASSWNNDKPLPEFYNTL